MLSFVLFGLAWASETADLALSEGMAAQQSGRTTEAIALYDRCIEIDPAHVRCHWELGWSHYSLGDWPRVVAAWEKVEELSPEHPELDQWLPVARGHVASLEKIKESAASAPVTFTSKVAEGQTLRVRAVGDIMLGTDFPEGHMPPDDGAKLLDGVRDLLKDADLTFGNLEGPLCDAGETRKCGASGNCYAFRTPTRYGDYLQSAGMDVMSTANNHSGDFGEFCRRQTEAALDQRDIAWSGPPGSIASLERAGFRIAMIGFHSSRACNYINDHETAAALVGAAKAEHDLVIVSFHGGAEGSKALHVPDEMELFYNEKRGHLRKFARAVVAAGADLVLGHGPHVPRGLEIVDGHLVAYSLGNFATYGRFNLSGHLGTSLVLEVELGHDGTLRGGRILPVKQLGEGIPVVDDNQTAIDLIRSLSNEDFPGTAPVIAKDGSFGPRAPAP